jgi:ADP-ribose pyrophosphatase YjhB (NUDIX family)
MPLMNQLSLINPEGVSKEVAATYDRRTAARAVVLDQEGKVALCHATKKGGYYKLPGGGVEEGEDERAALDRECEEEIGCHVTVVAELGTITEYRKPAKLLQVSHCYLAKVEGEKGTPQLTPEEIADGFETVWLAPADAERAIAESTTIDWEGPMIVERDLTFVREAMRLL